MVVYAEIEIAAPPDHVRKTFFDFPSLSTWHTGFTKAFVPLAAPSNPDPLATGKQLRYETSDGGSYVCTITVNSPTELTWQGPPVMGILAGLHTFEFRPSIKTECGTTFVQREEFSGVGAFLMAGWPMGGVMRGRFEVFNADLKREAERRLE